MPPVGRQGIDRRRGSVRDAFRDERRLAEFLQSLDGDQREDRRRIEILEAVPPPTAAAGVYLPPHVPRIAVRNTLDYVASRWPGGVICVKAAAFVTGGATSSPDAGEGWATDEAVDTQTAATPAAAADSITFTPEQVGLVPGKRYWVQVGARHTGSPTGPKVSLYINGSLQATRNVNTDDNGGADAWFGFYRFARTTAIPAGASISIRAFKTGGSGDVRLDQVYLIPDDTINADALEDRIQNLNQFGFWGGTATTGVDGDGNDTVIDNQYRDSIQDPAWTWSLWGFMDWAGYFLPPETTLEGYSADEIFRPRHTYIEAAVIGSSALFQWPAHITLGLSTVPYESLAIEKRSWGLVYGGVRSWDFYAGIQMALWFNNPPASPSNNDPSLPWPDSQVAGLSAAVSDLHLVADDTDVTNPPGWVA